MSELVLRGGVVHLGTGEVRRSDGRRARLTDLELRLVAFLADRPRVRVDRDELLREVWRIENPGLTRAVDAAIKRLRKKIEVEPSSPDHIRKAHGLGYAFHPLAVARTDGLLGRDALLVDVRERLVTARLLTLTGPAGVGKSRIAAVLGPVVPLGDARTPAAVVAATARALDIRLAEDRDDPATRLAGALPAGILVLDDADLPPEELVPVLRPWLAVPGLHLVVTARQPLGAPEEHVVRIAPLDPDAAAELLLMRIEAAGRAISAADRDLAPVVAEELDRLPLAIELAARRAAVIGLPTLRALLVDRFAVLDGEGRSLRGALAASIDRLEPVHRAALAACAAFRGGFSLTAAAAVLDVPVPRAAELLQALVERSVVLLDPTTGRFDLLRAIRDLAPPGPEAVARHGAWFLAHGAEADRENLEAALASAAGAERVRLAVRLDVVSEGTDLPADRLARLEGALRTAPLVPSELLAEACRRAGRAAGLVGHHDLAAAWLRRALDAADGPSRARIASMLGTALRLVGQHDDARAVMADALPTAPEGEAGLLEWGLGTVARAQGRTDDARAHYLRAIECRDERARGLALESLGVLIRDRDAVGARRCYEQAVAALDRAGEMHGAIHSRCNLGLLLLDLGEAAAADALLTRAAADAARHGLTGVGALANAALALTRVLRDEPGPEAMPTAGLAGSAAELAVAVRAARGGDLAGALAALARADQAFPAPALRPLRAVALAWLDPEAALALLPADPDPLSRAVGRYAEAVAATVRGRRTPLPVPEPELRTHRGASLLDVARILATPPSSATRT